MLPTKLLFSPMTPLITRDRLVRGLADEVCRERSYRRVPGVVFFYSIRNYLGSKNRVHHLTDLQGRCAADG
jgi:hypothetical protein